jgi:hypothetical protein
MLELLGGLFGGAMRMAPEVLKWLDRKDERKHELAMFEKQVTMEKMKNEQQLAIGQQSITLSEIQGIVEGVRAQATTTGIRIIDGINSLMRPTITFWWVIVLYTLVLYGQWDVLRNAGMASMDAILSLWGPQEKMIVNSIIGFWFVDRALRVSK